MSLASKIRAIYPDLTDRDFSKNIVLQNDSDGKDDYIAKWEHPTLARPTAQQLAEGNELLPADEQNQGA